MDSVNQGTSPVFQSLLTNIVPGENPPAVTNTDIDETAVNSNAGFIKNSIDIDGYKAHYYEGGNSDGDILILLHGLGDEKNSFIGSLSEIAKTHRVILPDLQGHGENAQIEGRNYSIKGQVDFLDNLFSAIGAKSFYIGGNSMGGHTAASYVYHHQDKVKGLILLNATGMQINQKSVYLYYPETVDSKFFKEMFGRVFVNPPRFPESVMKSMIDDLNSKIPFFNKLIAEVESGEDFAMDEKIKDIKVPSLVLWGSKDPVVPLPYAKAFHNGLPRSELREIYAGHSPQFEVPEVVQSEFLRFLKNN